MEFIRQALSLAVSWVWGPPLLILLLGGGLYLTVKSRGLPFFGARHAVDLLRGRAGSSQGPGHLSHFQALSTALSSTIGLGNIGGVAIAITQGGPGAVFWMWIAALVGMGTKFFTCTLAVMYRKRNPDGELQGGPMYTIELGLGKRFRPLGLFFASCGLVGCLGIFQSNQVAGILQQTYDVPPVLTGGIAALLVAMVSLGGVERIGNFTSRLVPAMCLVYLAAAIAVVVTRFEMVPVVFGQIFHDAWNGTAAAGGAAGIAWTQVVRTGIKRAAFSNEAGLGTAPLAHGAARTSEPVREGLVAMLGPFIDTIIVCTITAFVILSTGLWRQAEGVEGVTLTVRAFEMSLGSPGRLLLVLSALLFGLSTMVANAYYGRKCFSYLTSGRGIGAYNLFYLTMLFLGAVWSVGAVIDLVDTAYALMAVPNMIATLILAPKVMHATRDYFRRLDLAASVGPTADGPTATGSAD